MHDVSIILAWRDSGNANRQANLAAVLDHLTPTGLPIVLADDGRGQGPFNRSAAYNHGMRLSPSEVYAFHEADMLVPLPQLEASVELAREGLGLVVPFDQYRYLSEEVSRLVISEALQPVAADAEWTMDNGRSIGAVNVVSAESMRWVGQWDEALEGHGYDDNVMHRAFEVACGPTRFVPGPGYHLWHPMAFAPWERNTEAAEAKNFTPEEVAATMRNQIRLRDYQAATTPEQIRELTGAPW